MLYTKADLASSDHGMFHKPSCMCNGLAVGEALREGLPVKMAQHHHSYRRLQHCPWAGSRTWTRP